MVAFARRIAQGDLSARLDISRARRTVGDGSALNQTAERLGQNFAEIESRRHELATMLDSMQEAVVAITAGRSGALVERRDAAHRRDADSRRTSAGSLRARSRTAGTACAARLQDGEVRFGRASSLAPGAMFEINAAPLALGRRAWLCCTM